MIRLEYICNDCGHVDYIDVNLHGGGHDIPELNCCGMINHKPMLYNWTTTQLNYLKEELNHVPVNQVRIHLEKPMKLQRISYR